MGLVAQRTVEVAAWRYIRLAADNRGETRFAGGGVELHRSVHDAVVREGDGRGSELGDALTEPLDAACAVEERVFGMNVKMNELTQVSLLNPGRA